MSAVEGAEGGEWAQAGLWARGWPAVALREERGEEDGGAREGGGRDGIGSGRRMDQSTTSQADWQSGTNGCGGLVVRARSCRQAFPSTLPSRT